MTGIEGVGALVGIVSSTFTVLDSCIRGFQLLSTALHLGKHAAYLRSALLLEEELLISWAKHSGLSDDSLDRRLNRALIDETLGHLNILLNDLDNLKKRYKLSVSFDDPPEHQEIEHSANADVSEGGLEFLQQGHIIQERERIHQRAKTIRKHVALKKKFWFAAVDKSKFEELLHQVHNLTGGLRNLLNDTQKAAFQDDILLLRLQNINILKKQEQLESLINAFAISITTASPESVVARLKAIKIRGQDELSNLDRDAVYESDLQGLLQHQPISIQSSLQPVFSENLSPEQPFGISGLQALREYDGLPVYVEWKKYDWAVRAEETKKKALSSIASLALLFSAPKTPRFRTLHCMGLLREERAQRCQLIYSWPEACDPHVKPKSLFDYLSSSYTPSLTERLQLAKELAGSLFLFHASGWLHKALSSTNILFFPIRTDSDKSLQDPFIVGFEYSRPDLPGQPSEKPEKKPYLDIFRPPEYLDDPSPPFHKVFDIYAFGLLLIEVAKWRPLKFVFLQIALASHLKEERRDPKSVSSQERKTIEDSLWEKCTRADIANMRTTLMDRKGKNPHPTDIAFRAGSILEEVILWCLGCSLHNYGDDDVSGQKLQEEFFRNVIKRLDQCVV